MLGSAPKLPRKDYPLRDAMSRRRTSDVVVESAST